MASKDWVSAEKQDKNSDQIEELEKVPPLRFPEFSGNWNGIKLKRIFTNKTSNLSINNLLENKGEYKLYGATGLIKCIDFYEINVPYVAIVKDGAGVGRITLCDENSSILGTMQALIAKEDFDLKFSYYSLNKINFNKYVIGSTIPHIYFKDYSKETVFVPSINEQKKISAFITLVDKKIELMEKKYDSLKLYKKGLVQQIFSQEIRFKNSENMFNDWKNRKLSDFLFEHKLKSTGNEEVYSVSVHKGLVNQIEHLGRDFSSKNTSKYNLVKPGDIVYTKSPTGEFPLGIIKQSQINKDVIVSPLYGVFSPETFDLGYILNEYFESEVNTYNYLHPIVQKGAKNTMNISNKTFLSKTLFVPTDKNEQKLIHTILAKINKKIDSVEQQLEKIKEFKGYLLQQMFV